MTPDSQTPEKSKALLDMFRELRAGGDSSLRDRIIEQHINMPKFFANRFGKHEQQEEIRHSVYLYLGLPHPHGFDDNNFKSRSFTEQHGFSGIVGDASQGKACRRWPDISE